jgi:hypothetical protein
MTQVAALSLLLCTYFLPIEKDLGHSKEVIKLHKLEVKYNLQCKTKLAPELINNFAQECNNGKCSKVVK